MSFGIRKLMLECPNFVREAILTDDEITLYYRVRDRGLSGMKSHELADEDCLSIPNAHAKLNKLHKKKYLRKVDGVAPSGGKEFTFLAIEF